MAKTLEGKEGGVVLPTPHGAPEQEMISAPEKKVALHEMPDLNKEAPEVTYGQPKRSWLRYLAVGLTVGAVAVAGGLVISAVTTTDTAPQFSNEYSLAREHLAQTPGGFPLITPSGQVVPNSQKLVYEHLVQAPVAVQYAYPNAGPVNDAPGALVLLPNQGPVNDAPAA
jgi:hypothetical protein